MSIADELNHLSGDIGDAYDAVDDMGGVIPAAKNMDNLDTAIRTIPQPTVNDGTLTIQKNGTNVATFTANQASNATANITVPTNTSDLNNDSGFITSSSLPGDMTGATSGAAGAHGLVPAPSAGDEGKFLSGAGTWVAVSPSSSDVVTLYCYWGDASYTFTPYYDEAHTQAVSYFDFIQLVRTKNVTLMWDDHDGYNYTQTIIASFVDSYDPTDPQNPPSSIIFVAAQAGYLVGKGDLIEYTWDSGDSRFSSLGSRLIPKQTSDLTNNGADGTSTYVEADELATVATTGAYSDLSGTPTIPTVNDATLTITQNGSSVGTFTANASSNATIALTDTTYSTMTGATSGAAGTSGLVPAPAAGDDTKFLSGDGTWKTVSSGGGSYTAGNGISIDANNEISIDTAVVAEVSDLPTKTSDLQNDGSDGTSTYVEADDLATVATSGSYSDLSGTPNLATVATSGSYTDLTNTPSIPAAQVNSDWDANSGVAEILNKPVLATVATTGAYSDLTGTPTIPTVNDGTLTIQHNGTNKGWFTANAQNNKTINIETIYADDYIDTTALTPVVSTSMIEDEAVTTAKIDDGAVTAAKTAFGGNYSTTEVDTGFTWIDGKPIYKKTINTGQIPSGASTVTFDISGLNLDKLIKLEGRCMDPTSGNCRVMPNVARTLEDMIRIDIQSKNTLRIITAANSDWSGYSESTVTLWYTKSS